MKQPDKAVANIRPFLSGFRIKAERKTGVIIQQR